MFVFVICIYRIFAQSTNGFTDFYVISNNLSKHMSTAHLRYFYRVYNLNEQKSEM